MIDYIWNYTEDIPEIYERCMDTISFEEVDYLTSDKYVFRNIGKDKGLGDFIRCYGSYTDPLNFKSEEYSSDTMDYKTKMRFISPFKYVIKGSISMADMMEY